MKRLTFVLAAILAVGCSVYGQSRQSIPRLEATTEFRPPVKTDCTSLSSQREGDLCFDSSDNQLMVYQDGSYVPAGSAAAACATDPPVGACSTGALCVDETNQNLYYCKNAGWVIISGAGGSGDVLGPGTSVDNSIPRFDGTTGKILQGHPADSPTISDAQVLAISGINTTRYVNKFADAGTGAVGAPWTGWEDAFTSIPTEGQTVVFEPGYYTQNVDIDLPVNQEGVLRITGPGATIKLTTGAPRFLDIGWTADNDTLQNIIIEGMTIDADNIIGRHHVILGNYQNALTATAQCLNVDNLILRDITTLNVASGDSSTTHRLNVWLAIVDPAGAPGSCTQGDATVTNVFIERLVLNGGNMGIVVAGTNGDPAEVYLDNIHIHDNYHDRGGPTIAFTASSHIHLGSRAYGGYAHVSGNVGKNSADVGIEINGFKSLLAENNYMENVYLAAFLSKNFTDKIDLEQQTYQWSNNRAAWTDGTHETATRRGMAVTASGTYSFGNAVIDGYTATTDGTKNDGTGFCARFYSENALYVRSVHLSDVLCVADSLADSTGVNGSFNFINAELEGTVESTLVRMSDVELIARGTDGAGTHTLVGFGLDADGGSRLFMDNISCDFNVVGADAAAHRCIQLGNAVSSPANTMVAEINGLRVRMDDNATPRGIVITGNDPDDNTGQIYTTPVIVSNSDFSRLSANGTAVLLGKVNGDCTALDTPYACCTGLDTGTCNEGYDLYVGIDNQMPGNPVDVRMHGNYRQTFEGEAFQNAITLQTTQGTNTVDTPNLRFTDSGGEDMYISHRNDGLAVLGDSQVQIFRVDDTAKTLQIEAGDPCIAVDSGSLYQDDNCDGTLAGADEYLNNAATSPGADSIGTNELNDIEAAVVGECVVVAAGGLTFEYDTCGSGGAPAAAQYLVGAADATLSAEVVIATLGDLNTHLGSTLNNGTHTTDASLLSTGTIPAARAGADHIDTITEIATGVKSGADVTLVTGTSGTSGNCIEWDALGDAVDSGQSCATIGDVISVGDCAGGACLNGTSGAGTQITLYDIGGNVVMDWDGTNLDFTGPITATSFTADDPGDNLRGMTLTDNSANCADPTAGETSLCAIGGSVYIRDTAGSSEEVYAAAGTDVPVTDGGTGASTASGARTNLGVAIDSDVQRWDTDLDTLATMVLEGADTNLLTGTQGNDGDCAQWNIDGDLVTTGASCGGAGSGDGIEVEDGDDAGTFTVVDTDGRFDDSGDINFTHADGGAGGPDVITATVRADSVALGTDTTGGYAGSTTEGGAATTVAANAVGSSEMDLTAAFAWTGDHDFSAGGIEIENGTTPPACTEGQLFLDTDAPQGQQLMACDGGTFFLQGDGGASGALDGLSDVTITTPATGATLVKSAGDWVDGQLDLADTDAVTNELTVTNGGTGAATLTDGGILLGSDSGAITALGVATNGQIPIGDGATDPVLGTISGTANEIEITNGAGTIQVGIPASPTLDGTNFTAIPTSGLLTELRSMYWGAGAMSADGTLCADPAEATINSGPKMYTVLCADDNGSTLYGSTIMPDGWNAGTVTFELGYIQTAADTAILNSDIAAQCHAAGETVNSTWGTEIAIDDGAVTGSNALDLTTSAAVTAAGTCAAGDMLFWRWQMDVATTTAVGTLHIVGLKMEYTTDIGD